MADVSKTGSWREPDEPAALDPQGESLASDYLGEPEGGWVLSSDETEAEELEDVAGGSPGLRDTGSTAQRVDVDSVIDDPGQLEDAEQVAAAAASTQPQRRRPNAPVRAVRVPEKKEQPTRRRGAVAVDERPRTGPVTFVNQSIGELRKVVWPTGSQLQQYFVVVLVFVLFIIAFVGLLDLLFGWLLLKALG